MPKSDKKGRSELSALGVGRLFGQTIKDVKTAGEEAEFRGVVDIAVTFKSVAVDNKGGLLRVFTGSDPKESTVEVQLATRLHLDDADAGKQ